MKEHTVMILTIARRGTFEKTEAKVPHTVRLHATNEKKKNRNGENSYFILANSESLGGKLKCQRVFAK